MEDRKHTRIPAFALFVVAAVLVSAGVWWFSFISALGQLEQRGRADLTVASDRLSSQLLIYREIAVLLANHPVLQNTLEGSETKPAAERFLLETSDLTGSLNIMLADRDGVIRATGQSDLGMRAVPTDTSYFRRALTGALGSRNAYSDIFQRRIFRFAAPVFAATGPVIGAVIVDADIEAIEADWRGDPSPVFFSDRSGVVFASNRSELIFRSREPVTEAIRATSPDIEDFIDHNSYAIGGHEIWLTDAGRYIPRRALHLTRDVPVYSMRGEVLLDIAPAMRLATLQAAFASALFLAFGALLFLATERRRALGEKLVIEAAANARLEERVEMRTRELRKANLSLRHEISERQEAEAALKRAQADLVQAGKLSALGKMSAGISHELNQPLMAIRSFAENAEQFLVSERPDQAARNLSRISELARRMGRIIKNLRTFASQGAQEISDVDVVKVIADVLELSQARLNHEAVTLHWDPPAEPVFARGGPVRLQQVLMNLLSNAVDAMEGQSDKEIAIDLTATAQTVLLSVRDNGPGIDQTEKMFDPFYSTKKVGQSEGMGLGLSISYGIVQSFGGVIRGRNHPRGGAEFTVELKPAKLAKAA